MNTLVKYPRTPHLPFSEGRTSDDIVAGDVNCFVGKEVVVLEKMDGENCTISRTHIHARSLDSNNHPSRNWVKALWGNIRHEIPEDMRICGENIYAKHSICYSELPSYFLVFGIYEKDMCLSWSDTVEICGMLGLSYVPILRVGQWDEQEVKECMTGKSRCGGEQEGYVVRLAGSFNIADFGSSVMKYVRKGHVQTEEHWMSGPVIPNRLKI